jgi:hypothetical protein
MILLVTKLGESPVGTITRADEEPALEKPAPHNIPSKNKPINNFLSI